MHKLITFILFITISYSQNFSPIPKSKEAHVKHRYYTLEYVEKHEQPSWVHYLITKKRPINVVDRKGSFRQDPLVKTKTATNKDYAKQGFDKGHLANAEDMSFNKDAMYDSFYYSNASPQLPEFNRGVWKRLEEHVRNFQSQYDTIYVTTGPVFKNNIKTIGTNRVTVPGWYYKAVLRVKDGKYDAKGYLLKHESSKAKLSTFELSIDEIELQTGIDFFPDLPDKIENKIEKKSIHSTKRKYYRSYHKKDILDNKLDFHIILLEDLTKLKNLISKDISVFELLSIELEYGIPDGNTYHRSFDLEFLRKKHKIYCDLDKNYKIKKIYFNTSEISPKKFLWLKEEYKKYYTIPKYHSFDGQTTNKYFTEIIEINENFPEIILEYNKKKIGEKNTKFTIGSEK